MILILQYSYQSYTNLFDYVLQAFPKGLTKAFAAEHGTHIQSARLLCGSIFGALELPTSSYSMMPSTEVYLLY